MNLQRKVKKRNEPWSLKTTHGFVNPWKGKTIQGFGRWFIKSFKYIY